MVGLKRKLDAVVLGMLPMRVGELYALAPSSDAESMASKLIVYE